MRPIPSRAVAFHFFSRIPLPLACRVAFPCLIGFAWLIAQQGAIGQTPWTRHAIDQSFRGADGVRLGDFDGDGWADVVTGWEESGLVRLYLHPGPSSVTAPWPAVTLGQARSPEDAVPMDVDGDGRLDVVSCHEGKQRQVLVHWNNAIGQSPAEDSARRKQLLDPQRWDSDRFVALDGVMWMFALPLRVHSSGPALVVGAKGNNASITLLLSPRENRRKLSDWRVIRLRDAGWIMSLRSVDMDGDGDQDILFSDRKGDSRIAAWLEQPDDPGQPWREHPIAGRDREVMFLSGDQQRCLIATRNHDSLDCRRSKDGWTVQTIDHPPGADLGKAIEALPGGQLVMTFNTAASKNRDTPGIWRRDQNGSWSPLDPTTRVKFDRMECVDLDGDGDLDLMTCEERRNLGVIWYENPETQPRRDGPPTR